MDEQNERVDWMDLFDSMTGVMTNPVVSVPMELYEAERDEIVTAARKNGFMRVLFLKDIGNAHFCRYV